ncbi:MAG: hypothetical protein ACRAVC_05990 [Trichormus sp.]
MLSSHEGKVIFRMSLNYHKAGTGGQGAGGRGHGAGGAGGAGEQGGQGSRGDKGEIFTPMPYTQCPMPNYELRRR